MQTFGRMLLIPGLYPGRLEGRDQKPAWFLVAWLSFLFPELMMYGSFPQHLRAAFGALLFLARNAPAVGHLFTTLGAYAVTAWTHSLGYFAC